VSTEVAATITDLYLASLGIGDMRLVDAKMLPPLDLQASIVTTKIDRVAAATRCLATDRAVAAHERIRLRGF
jgi:hypothetical protein